MSLSSSRRLAQILLKIDRLNHLCLTLNILFGKKGKLSKKTKLSSKDRNDWGLRMSSFTKCSIDGYIITILNNLNFYYCGSLLSFLDNTFSICAHYHLPRLWYLTHKDCCNYTCLADIHIFNLKILCWSKVNWLDAQTLNSHFLRIRLSSLERFWSLKLST